MARKYANILTAIWRNEEFVALGADEQRMYLLLASQPDISAAGVLHLSVTRWSAMARNTPPDAVVAALQGLARGRFVIFDVRTEELLVRSFVRWDGGYTNSKRRPVIRDAAQEVLSSTIRRALALEFKRLGLPDWLPDALPDALPDSPSDTTPGPLPDALPLGIGDDLSAQGNRLSDTPSDTVSPSERVVVTKGPYLDPQPTTHNPQPTPSAPALRAAPETLTVNQRSKTITDEYTSVVKLSRWPAINGIVSKAIKTGEWTDQAIREAIMRLAHEGRPVTVDSLRVELNGITPRASPDQQFTEINGLMLKPSNVANLQRQQRMRALDERNAQPKAIEGGTA